VYRSFAQERFEQLSYGGGEWPPISTATMLGRRQGEAVNLVGARKARSTKTGRYTKRPRTLWDTGTLFHALDPVFRNKPGAIQKDIPFGVRVGFGGGKKHPKGKMTVARLAFIHHHGKGRMPQRKLIVTPNARTRALMKRIMTKQLAKMI